MLQLTVTGSEGGPFSDVIDALPRSALPLYRSIEKSYRSDHFLLTFDAVTVGATDAMGPSTIQRDAISDLLEALHAPSMVTALFQTYEGELRLVGPKKLLWHRLAINPQKFQVLPARQRKFPFAPSNVHEKSSTEAEAGTGTGTGTSGTKQEVATAPAAAKANSSSYGITRSRDRDATDIALDTARAALQADLMESARLVKEEEGARASTCTAGEVTGPGPATGKTQDACAIAANDIWHTFSGRIRRTVDSRVIPVVSSCLPITRYQEQALALAVHVLAVLEVHCLTYCLPVWLADEIRDTIGVLCDALKGLFEQQAEIVMQLDAQEALVWQRRAEQVHTQNPVPVKTRKSAPVSVPVSARGHGKRFLAAVERAKLLVEECTVAAIKDHMSQHSSPSSHASQTYVLDVREKHEFDAGHYIHALHVGKGVIERDIESLNLPDDADIILYCGGGYRSALAAQALQQMGWARVKSLVGGYTSIVQSGLPCTAALAPATPTLSVASISGATSFTDSGLLNQCKCCRLAGDLIGYRYYTHLLLASPEHRQGQAAKKEGQRMLAVLAAAA